MAGAARRGQGVSGGDGCSSRATQTRVRTPALPTAQLPNRVVLGVLVRRT